MNYRQLDGLRAIAAMAVVAFHYCPHGASWLNALIASGPAAVGFFFLLSGFVLAQRYPEVADRGGFWRARFIRVYPMYLFAFLLFAPLAFEKYHHDPKMLATSFLVNISMLQAWTNLAQSWNGPSWSLSVEAFLYGVFPFVIARVGKRPNPIHWGILALVPAMLTVGFCNQWVSGDLWRAWVQNNPLFGLPAFTFGIALGLFRFRLPALRRGTDLQILACLFGIVVTALVWPARYREVFVAGGAIVLLGTLVILCTFRSPVMQALFGNKLMVRLGKASYITYIMQSPLWHYYQLILNLIKRQPLDESNNGIVQFLIFAGILLFVSIALNRFVDEPIRSILSKPKVTAQIHIAAAA